MQNKELSDFGKQGVETARSQNYPAWFDDCEMAGNPSPSSSDFYSIGTWNVRRLCKVVNHMMHGIMGLIELIMYNFMANDLKITCTVYLCLKLTNTHVNGD